MTYLYIPVALRKTRHNKRDKQKKIALACDATFTTQLSIIFLVTTRIYMASRTLNLEIVTPMGETNASGRTNSTRDLIQWNKTDSRVSLWCDDMNLNRDMEDGGGRKHISCCLFLGRDNDLLKYIFLSRPGERQQ